MNILPLFLPAFLPIRVAYYRQKGGASDADYEKLEAIAEKICSQGTALQWKNADGSTKEIVADLIDALAIAACPPQNASPDLIEMAHYREAQIYRFIDALGKNSN